MAKTNKDKNVRDLLAQQQGIYSTRNSNFQKNRKFYYGDETEWWNNDFYKDDRVNSTFNYARPIVEKSAAFLFGDQPDYAVRPPSPKKQDLIKSSKTEGLLYEILRRNHFGRTGLTAAKESALLGISWVKVFMENREKKPYFPRIVLCKPEYVYPEVYQSVYAERLQYVLYSYQLSLEVARAEYGQDVQPESELEYEDASKKEKSQDLTTYIEYWSDDQYILEVGGKEIENGENPYGFIPFIPLPWLTDPGRLHGISCVQDMLEANQLLNILESRKADSVFMHCNPPLKYLKARLTSRDEFEKDLEGGCHFLPGESDLKYLSWEGEPPDVGELQNFLMRYIFDSSFMPETAFTGNGAGLTGVALRVGFDPLIKMIHQVRGNWEPGLQRIMEYVLRLTEQYMASTEIVETVIAKGVKKPTSHVLKGSDINGCYEVDVIWKDMLPKDDINSASFEIQKYKENVQSLWTTMERLGMPQPDEEMERMKQEFAEPAFKTKETATMQGADAKSLLALTKAQEMNQQMQMPLENQANVEMNPMQENPAIAPMSPGIEAAPTTPAESEGAWSQTEGAGSPESMF